jgi:hypothetical protein
MPEEAILDGYDQKRDYRYKNYLGKNVIVESRENGKGVIVQLLSTNPNDFLDSTFLPGNEIIQNDY